MSNSQRYNNTNIHIASTQQCHMTQIDEEYSSLVFDLLSKHLGVALSFAVKIFCAMWLKYNKNAYLAKCHIMISQVTWQGGKKSHDWKRSHMIKHKPPSLHMGYWLALCVPTFGKISRISLYFILNMQVNCWKIEI